MAWHAEGYPAAEMKHGPIALIDEEMPIVVIATKGDNYEKVVSNIQEVKAIESLSIQEKELELIKKSLDKHEGKRKLAAKELGISERTLYRKIKQFDL